MLREFDNVMAANMVMMMRADVDGAIWVVDDEEESRFYEMGAHEHGRVIPAFGGTLEILRIVLERGLQGVVGMTRGRSAEARELSLFRPDIGDVASLLLSSRGSDRVLGEVGGATWLTACGREIGGVLLRAVQLARVIERVIPAPAVVSDDAINRFVRWEEADIDWNQIEEEVRAGRIGNEQVAAARGIASSDRLAQDLLDCDGMTAVRVLAAATRSYRPRGIPAYRGVEGEELLSLLRTGFDFEEIESEGVYWRLKEWQWRNRRYSLFRQWRKLEPFNMLLDQRYIATDLAHLASGALPFAAFQVDLDHFKAVNDRLGHPEGDEAIKFVQRMLLTAIGGRGEAYRRGGDELVAVIVGISRAEAARFAEDLRGNISAGFLAWAEARGHVPAPTASVGVVHVERGCELDTLVRELEAAQLDAKRQGKNRVVFREVE